MYEIEKDKLIKILKHHHLYHKHYLNKRDSNFDIEANYNDCLKIIAKIYGLNPYNGVIFHLSHRGY